MRIRKTTLNDLEPVMAMYDYARKFMQEHGNPNQWINGYPSEEYIRREIADGEDPTYAVIDNGKWLNDAPYGVIHRMASNGKEKGIADQCIRWCFEQHHNIRVDTHHDNYVMQNILKKNGFEECGIIYTHNGSPRIAYQKNV